MIINDLKNMNYNSKAEKRYFVAYLRKSSESEDRQVQSIDDQRNVITPLAKEKNLEILETFEESRSAKAPGRTEFDRMIATIRNRDDIKGIISWKLNRLSRNPVDTGALQWLLQEKKIDEIVTPTKTYTEIDSDFIMAVEGAQAQRFIRDLKEDTWRGMKSKIEKGIAPLLASPGYKNDISKKQGERDIVVDPVQFPLMRKLFDLALTGDYSITKLYFVAKEMGIKTNRGNEISRSRMAEILKNVFYIGKFVYAGQTYDGIHEPMLSTDEFELLQDIFSRGDRPRPVNHEHPYPDGLIRCVCGRSLVFEPKIKRYKNGTSQNFVYLRCNRHKYQPSAECPKSAINIEDLHPQIVEKLGSVKISQDLVAWGIKRLNEKNQNKQELREAEFTSIKKSYDDVVARLDNLLKLKLSPLNTNGVMMSDLEYVERRVELLKERDKFNYSLKKLDQKREDWADLAVGVFNFASRAQERYANGDLETRRDICRIFGTSLFLNGKTLELHPRTPFVYITDAIQSSELNKMPVNSQNMAIHAFEDTIGVEDGT